MIKKLLASCLLAYTSLALAEIKTYQVSPLDLRPDNQIPKDWQVLEKAVSVQAAKGEITDVVIALSAQKRAYNAVWLDFSPLIHKNGSRIDVPPERLRSVVCYYGPKGGLSGPKDWKAKDSYQYEPFALMYNAKLIEVNHKRQRTLKKYRGFPDDRPPLKPRGLAKNEIRQWYASIPIPKTASKGIYKGTIRVMSRDKVIMNIAIELEVFPFELLPPAKVYGMYQNLYDLSPDDPRYLLMLKDLKEHGFEHVMTSITRKKVNDPNGKLSYNYEDIEKRMALQDEAGLNPRFTFGAGSSFFNFYATQKDPKKLAKQLDKDAILAKELADYWRIRKFPTLSLYGIDEGHGEDLQNAAKRYEVLQENGIPITAAVFEGWYKYAGSSIKYPILAGSLAPSDQALANVAYARKGDCVVLSYDGPQMIYHDPLLYRVRTGFNLWNSIYDGWFPFTYAWRLEDHENGKIVTVGGDDTFKWHGVVLVGKDRMIPQVEWPAMRQGVTDVRYATTLSALLMKAKELKLDDNRLIQAENYLRNLPIQVQNYESIEQIRKNIANYLIQLQGLHKDLNTLYLNRNVNFEKLDKINHWIRPKLDFRPYPMGMNELEEEFKAVDQAILAGDSVDALLRLYELKGKVEAWQGEEKISRLEKVIIEAKRGSKVIEVERLALGTGPKAFTKSFDLVKDISDEWTFAPDRGDDGKKNLWYAKEFDRSDWQAIDVNKLWQQQGVANWIDLEGPRVGMMGIGWYYKELNVPKEWIGKEYYLWFKSDEDADIWVNGKHVKHRSEGPASIRWNTPALLPLKGLLKQGSNQLVIRVFNVAQGGGLWHGLRVIKRKDMK